MLLKYCSSYWNTFHYFAFLNVFDCTAVSSLSFFLSLSVEWLILDEADKLFEEGKAGFREQVATIYQACDKPDIRRALFSATLSNGIEDWARLHLDNVVRVTVGVRSVKVHSPKKILLVFHFTFHSLHCLASFLFSFLFPSIHPSFFPFIFLPSFCPFLFPSLPPSLIPSLPSSLFLSFITFCFVFLPLNIQVFT